MYYQNPEKTTKISISVHGMYKRWMNSNSQVQRQVVVVVVVIKRRDSAFQDTETRSSWLKALNMNMLVFRGVDTSI